MNITAVVGVTAAVLTTSCYVFQVAKSWKSKHTKDLSMGMFLTLLAGTVLWLVYGIMLNQPPIYLANGTTVLLSLSLVFLKFKYG
ncbi:MAG: SemiSWEET transporter [Patescibacteria group bacterium]|nr:SemiSWEET transporter [Patescibacteria group bacterium]